MRATTNKDMTKAIRKDIAAVIMMARREDDLTITLTRVTTLTRVDYMTVGTTATKVVIAMAGAGSIRSIDFKPRLTTGWAKSMVESGLSKTVWQLNRSATSLETLSYRRNSNT